MRRKFYFLILLAFLPFTEAQAQCPPGYASPAPFTTCVPNVPSTDFGQDSNGNPICGSGRVALLGDGSYGWTSFSSSFLPQSTIPTYSYNGQNYSYTSSQNPNPPIYGFPPGSRCYCLSTGTTQSISATQAPSSTYTVFDTIITAPSPGVPPVRQFPVTYDVITSQTQIASISYAPVAVSLNPSSSPSQDGRLYSLMKSGASTCGCPNVNEVAVSNGTDSANPGDVGSLCIPAVNALPTPTGVTTSVRVLTSFAQPQAPPATIAFQNSQIVSAYSTMTDATSGTEENTIYLPNSGSDQVGLTPYGRKIWMCATPFEVDSTSGNCVFTATHHACDAGGGTLSGGGGTVPASPVSNLITPSPGPGTYPTQFGNTVNKKLACCLNAFHSDGSDAYEKFDCIDNSATGLYSTFDALWSSTDAAADGGQPNAIVLSDTSVMSSGVSVPRIISGFYSLTGQHCDQFSEFGGTIQPYFVDPMTVAGQQLKSGSSKGYAANGNPLPYIAAFSTLANSKGIPQSQQDFLNCPLLVRAAIIATCPSATIAPNALASVNLSAGQTARCPVATGIQIHVRVEQVYTITGTAPAVPFDSIMNVNATTSLDVTNLILNKTGNQCPPMTSKKGDMCTY